MRNSAFWLALLLLLPGVTVGSEKPVVQVAFMEFAGYSELDESGQVVGKVVTLVSKLLTEAGYQMEAALLPAARIWQGLENGSVHAWPGILNKPVLGEHTLLTERDLGVVGISLYYLPGTPPPRWPDDLRNRSVITITNFTYTSDIWEVLNDPARNLAINRTSSHEGGLQMLQRGRGDYLLNYPAQVEPVFQRLDMEMLPSISLAEMPMRMLLSRHSGFAKQLRHDLDAAFDRLTERGVELDVTLQ